jgi:pantothenate kinase
LQLANAKKTNHKKSPIIVIASTKEANVSDSTATRAVQTIF